MNFFLIYRFYQFTELQGIFKYQNEHDKCENFSVMERLKVIFEENDKRNFF